MSLFVTLHFFLATSTRLGVGAPRPPGSVAGSAASGKALLMSEAFYQAGCLRSGSADVVREPAGPDIAPIFAGGSRRCTARHCSDTRTCDVNVGSRALILAVM